MSKENDEWFESVKECPFCGGSKFQRETYQTVQTEEVLCCLKCKAVVAASTDV